MMTNRDMEYWRRFFSNEKCDVFEIIESGIMAAAADCPNEFRLRRGRIAELLFSCESKRCVGCDHLELCVPLLAQNYDADGQMKISCDDNDDQAISYGDVEALNEEIEEESQLTGEVFRIKDVLTNSQDKSEAEIHELLNRLQYMALTVDILKSTEIGKAVNGLRKHNSSDVSHLAKQLIRVWKEMVDEWVNATTQIVEANYEGTPNSINPSVLDEEEGLPSPPMDEGAFFAPPQTMELSQIFKTVENSQRTLQIEGSHLMITKALQSESLILLTVPILSGKSTTAFVSRRIKQQFHSQETLPSPILDLVDLRKETLNHKQADS